MIPVSTNIADPSWWLKNKKVVTEVGITIFALGMIIALGMVFKEQVMHGAASTWNSAKSIGVSGGIVIAPFVITGTILIGFGIWRCRTKESETNSENVNNTLATTKEEDSKNVYSNRQSENVNRNGKAEQRDSNAIEKHLNFMFWQALSGQFPLPSTSFISALQQEMISNPDNQKILERHKKPLETLSIWVSKQENPTTIKSFLQNLDEFLTHCVFTRGLVLNSNLIELYKSFNVFFSILDKYLHLCEKNLKIRLKIKFANLPCQKNREFYSNLHLSKKDQVEVLIEYFQNLEDEHITKILKLGHLSSKDLSRLHVLKNKIKEENWKSLEEFIERIEKKESSETYSEEIIHFKRIVKAKDFFYRQRYKEEIDIQIPIWYHATEIFDTMKKILNDQKIELGIQGFVPGTWVSDKVELICGNYAFALDRRIQDLESNPQLHVQSGWKALRKDLPLQKNLVFGVLKVMDKKKRSQEKNECKKTSQEIPFYSYELYSVIHEGIKKCLGNPNLSLPWWGNLWVG